MAFQGGDSSGPGPLTYAVEMVETVEKVEFHPTLLNRTGLSSEETRRLFSIK